MSSNLPVLLKFCETDIDWELADYNARLSKIVELCDLWNNKHITDINVLSDKLKLNKITVNTYIKRINKMNSSMLFLNNIE